MARIAMILALLVPLAGPRAVAQTATTAPATRHVSDDAFLDDLQRRSFAFFLDQFSPRTGLISDRAPADGSRRGEVASIAATGFGLTALCVGAERGWIPRDRAYRRVLRTLRFLHDEMPHEHGFFYHFVDIETGQRVWNCELSSIDTALLMAGVLTCRQYFAGTEVDRLATALYQRVDWPWMLNGGETLSMGWTPEGGFLPHRWDNFSEHPILYILALGSRTHPLPASAWRAWRREPVVTYAGRTFLQCPPLFTHQYPHAWIDFRGLTDGQTDFWQNSVDATLAHRQFCIDLGASGRFAHYSADLWGITSSDSDEGYVAWGGPPATDNIDGTVVPCAAAGAMPFAPAECLRTLRHMHDAFRERIWSRYGFADAFNPATGWVGPDVIGIDLGVTLLMVENHRSGFVWGQFMQNDEIRRGLDRAGFRREGGDRTRDGTSDPVSADPARASGAR